MPVRTENDTSFDIGQRAPGYGRVGWSAVVFSLFGAAVAWSVELAINGSLGGTACLVGYGQNHATIRGWGHDAIIGVNLAALLIAIAAILIGLRSVRLTRTPDTFDVGDVVHSGEGRTHFLSMWAVFTSLLFFCAIAFNTIAVFWGGLCNM